MDFNSYLKAVCIKKNSHVCVGLDVDIEKIPPFLKSSDDPLFEFSKAIIDSTNEFTAAYKINTAFFEAYGSWGWKSLEKVVNYIPQQIIRIADAKRADIGNTSRMYAKAFFKELPFDALTVNPYLGKDAITPFIEDRGKGVFILCLTSNAGAQDFQYLSVESQKLYLKVAKKINEWNTNTNCGLVVGATHPEELKEIREITLGLPFLIPGIGAQGGDLALSVKYTFLTEYDSAIFNSSRGIIYASQDKDFADKAALKALELRDSINNLKRRKI